MTDAERIDAIFDKKDDETHSQWIARYAEGVNRVRVNILLSPSCDSLEGDEADMVLLAMANLEAAYRTLRIVSRKAK